MTATGIYMMRQKRNRAALAAKGAARSVLAAVFVMAIVMAFVLAPGANTPARASANNPPLPPVPPYTCNLNGDEYFGDGYTTLDNTEWLIWLDWVVYLHWLPPHMNMAQQLTTGMTYQALMVGALLDAKNEQETQRLMQQLAAEAHRDYQPDLTMCTFGTNVRSLAATEDKERVNTRMLDLTMQASQAVAGRIQRFGCERRSEKPVRAVQEGLLRHKRRHQLFAAGMRRRR